MTSAGKYFCSALGQTSARYFLRKSSWGINAPFPFLITSNGSIKNDFARTFAFGAVAFASEDSAVFQSKRSLHQCSREWILEILAGMSVARKLKTNSDCRVGIAN